MTVTDQIFGSLRGLPNVEIAYLAVLRAWLPAMLDVVERREGLALGSLLRPPTPESYIGGIDFDNWQQDLCPMIAVVVAPTGDTERNGSGYGSWFEVQVGADIFRENEHHARRDAGYYGMAIQAAILQNGGLGGLATRTTMTGAPGVEFVDDTERQHVLSRTTFMTYVDGLVDDTAGTGVSTPPDSPQYPVSPGQPWGDFPVVTSTPVTLVAEPPE